MNNAVRTKRGTGNAAATESEFHQTRTQEQARSTAIGSLGATENQVAPSYFTTSLQELAAQRLADGFADSHEVDALREEQPQLYAMVLERLPTDPATMLPLRITVPRIMDEGYWRRCCEARWPLGQLSKMVGGEKLLGKEYGWKRLFLEKVLCDFLMSLGSLNADTADGLLPATAVASSGTTRAAAAAAAAAAVAVSAGAVECTARDADASRFDLSRDDAAVAALRELCAVCRDYVHTVELPCQLVHFRFYEHLFAHAPGILSFRLSYGVANRGVRVGVADMLGFSDDDAAEMRQLLRHYTALESLRLPLNLLQDRHAQMIAAGLASSTRLRVLDLSQNALGDVAVVDAVAVLLSRPDFPLEELHLHDNRLGSAAAAALAEALHLNKTLRVLNVQQNRIGDEDGGALLVRALAVQPTLVDVNVSSNRLGGSTLRALADVLPQLSTLRVLRVSGNAALAGQRIRAEAPAAAVAGGAAAASSTSLPSASSITPAGSAKDSDAGAEREGEGGSTAAVSVTVAGGPAGSSTLADSRAANGAVGGEEGTTDGSKEERADGVLDAAAEPATQEAEAETAEYSEGGALLCDAVLANRSLVELDVRLCGFTAAEEQAMMGGVQQRVFQHRMETTVAAKEAERRRELKQRAEERVARMTGRVV